MISGHSVNLSLRRCSSKSMVLPSIAPASFGRSVGSSSLRTLATVTPPRINPSLFSLWQWMYERGATSFDDMSDLPVSLRTTLHERATLGSTLSIADEQISARDGTVKRAYALNDGQVIESVLMRYQDGRRTACISSQAGCAMGCTFCATGQMGLSRQLTTHEIFEQVQRFSSELQALDPPERLSGPKPRAHPRSRRSPFAVMGHGIQRSWNPTVMASNGHGIQRSWNPRSWHPTVMASNGHGIQRGLADSRCCMHRVHNRARSRSARCLRAVRRAL